jgi:hypothetical protein
MTQYVINIGAIPNDGTGDPLRTAFNETNLNFNQIFAAGPVLSNIQIANNKILTTNTNGNLILAPNGTGVVQSNVSIVPNLANLRNLGSTTNRWNTVYTQYVDVSGPVSLSQLTVTGNLTVNGNIIQIGNLVTDAKTIQLANTATTANAANGSGITVGANDNIATILYNSTSNVWTTNIGVSAVGNISGGYILGNGSQLIGLPASYGNANVVTLLAGFGSNTVSTTGNITGNYFIGNGSQFGQWIFNQSNLTVPTNGNIITGPGSDGNINFHPDGSGTVNIAGASPILLRLVGDEPNTLNRIEIDTYGNSNILGGTFTGVFYRGTPDTPEVVQSGDRLSSLRGKGYNGSTFANVSGLISIDAQGSWSNVSNGTHISFWTTPNNSNIIQESARLYAGGDYHQIIGNIVVDAGNVSATGNVTGNYFIGNGSQLTGISTANTGNVTFSDQIVIGTGISNLVSGLYLAPSSSSANAVQYLRVRGDVTYEPTHIHFDTGNNQYFNQFIGDDNKYVLLSNTGNIVINTSDYGSNTAQWTFGTTGNLTLPAGGNINTGPGSDGNINFHPDGSGTVNITGASPILLRLVGDEPNTLNRIEIDTYGNSNALGGTFTGVFYRGTPDTPEVVQSGDRLASLKGKGYNGSTLANVSGQITIDAQGTWSNVSNGTHISFWTTPNNSNVMQESARMYAAGDYHQIIGNIIVEAGFISASGNVTGNYILGNAILGAANLVLTTNNANIGNTESWTFGTTGSLTLPGGMIINGNINTLGSQTALLQPTDDLPLAFIASGANGSVISYWAEDIANLMTSNIAAIYTPLQNTQTVRIVTGSNGGNIAIYDFDKDGVFSTAQVSATGNVTGNYFSGNGSLLTGISASLPVANGTSNFDIATANGNATITANSASTWTFGTDSALTLPASSGQIGRSGYPNGIDLYNNNGGTGYVRMNYADESLISADSGGAHVQTTGGTWDFDTTGNLTAPGNVSAVGNIIGGNIVTSGSGGDITMTGGNITGAGNISAGNLIATGNIVLTGSLVGSGASPAPSLSGFSSVSAVTLSASGNVTAGNVSATGNVTAANFFGNGATLSNVATQVTGSWTVPVGNSTQSFTVPINNTYQLWVLGNIPNGIIVYNATVSVSNTNVPVLGQQFAWNYEGGGNILMFTSIPAQIVGTAGTISNAAPAVANTNVFTFGINNTSAGNVTVNYGYTKIS